MYFIEHGCKDFRCRDREFCISADLICDGVDHCDDGSDETSSNLCQSKSVFIFITLINVSM